MSQEHKIIYDKAYFEALRARNEEKLKAAKEYLGNKWLLHKDNAVKKQHGKFSILSA